MIEINKTEEPSFWKDYKKKYPREIYNSLDNSDKGKNIRRQLRKHLLEQQKYVCAYCCSSIDENGTLNEHIYPKESYPQKSMDYNNIVASCNDKKSQNQSCGSKKGNKFNEKLFVSPLEKDCESHFKFYPDGRIEGLDERGKYTIEILGLNSYRLVRARAAAYKNCESLYDKELIYEYYIKPQNGKYSAFIDMNRYFYHKGYYDNL